MGRTRTQSQSLSPLDLLCPMGNFHEKAPSTSYPSLYLSIKRVCSNSANKCPKNEATGPPGDIYPKVWEVKYTEWAAWIICHPKPV